MRDIDRVGANFGRDLERIDRELRLVAALRATARDELVVTPSVTVADQLLDERLLLMRTAAGPVSTVQ